MTDDPAATQPVQPVQAVPHPNAVAAGGSTGFGVLVVWLLGNVWPKVDFSAEDGALIAGGLAAVVLFVGRNGLLGVWRIVTHGTGQ